MAKNNIENIQQQIHNAELKMKKLEIYVKHQKELLALAQSEASSNTNSTSERVGE